MHEVVIRTNSGTLTITDTTGGKQYHYGSANELTITTGTTCYHEYGEILGKLNVKEGKVILEDKSSVSFINIPSDATVASIEVEIKSGADYGRVTAESQEILNSVSSKITSSETIQTLVASDKVVAIVNNVAYTTIEDAFDNFNEGDTFELFNDIDKASIPTQYSLIIPSNSTFNGHFYAIKGNVSFTVNSGSIIENTVFSMTQNKQARTQAQIERYGNADAGTLSSLYANNFSGKIVIKNCTFDTAEWDAIQAIPLAGAAIEISNCMFKHTIAEWKQNRYIHIQSADSGVDFTASIVNCDFYDTNSYLTNQAIEVYYMNDRTKLTISNNYINDYENSVANNHVACLGLKKNSGTGFDWIENLNDYSMKTEPNN